MGVNVMTIAAAAFAIIAASWHAGRTKHRRSLPTRIARLTRTGSLVTVVALAASCTPGPGDSVTQVGGGQVRVRFVGGDYAAFGAQSEAPDPPNGMLLVIPLDDLTRIGTATEADPVVFPDPTVFQIRNVDPHDAIVMFDRDEPTVGMLVLTRNGRSPTVVPGLCGYYGDPTQRQCVLESGAPHPS
jgi:hypothetical protein